LNSPVQLVLLLWPVQLCVVRDCDGCCCVIARRPGLLFDGACLVGVRIWFSGFGDGP